MNNLFKWLGFSFPVAGIICMILFASTATQWQHILHALSVFFLMGGASFVIGGGVGFLFGIPKMPIGQNNASRSIRANTNLEKVSDWLTKVLLGATIAGMSNILEVIQGISDSAAADLTLIANESIFISSMILYFFVCGFLNGYLITRILLPKAFAMQDKNNEENQAVPPKKLTLAELPQQTGTEENQDVVLEKKEIVSLQNDKEIPPKN